MSKSTKKKVESAKGRIVDYEEIRKIAECVNLSDIQTVSFSADARHPLNGVLVHSQEQQIEVRGKLIQANRGFCVSLIEFRYKIGDKDSVLATVQGSIIAAYSMTDKESLGKFSNETIQQFAEVNGIYNTWSYIREVVASSLTRLGLSGVLLPVWRPPSELPPLGEFAIMTFSPSMIDITDSDKPISNKS